MQERESQKIDPAKILENLERETVEEIDFDQLADLIRDHIDLLTEKNSLIVQLKFIKDDYRKRILGMLKAIMAGRSGSEDADLISRVADENDRLEVTDLVQLYRRVAARFRRHFPSSFKYITMPANQSRSWEEHKI